MSVDVDTDLVLERDILPVLFPPADVSVAPQLTVLWGAVGVEPRRAVTRARGEGRGGAAFLSMEALRVFHPDFLLRDRDPTSASGTRVDAVATEWLQACLTYGRTTRRSMVLGGGLSPALATAVGHRYRADGFDTRLVAVTAPPGVALLGSVSAAADRIRAGLLGPVDVVDDHTAARKDLLTLLEGAETKAAFSQITVFDDRGIILTDRNDTARAAVAVGFGSDRDLSAMESAQWLGELRRTTEFILGRRTPPRGLVTALVDLHEIAFQRILPALPVPRGSEVVAVEEDRLATRLAALRRVHGDDLERAGSGPPTVTPVPGRDGPGL